MPPPGGAAGLASAAPEALLLAQADRAFHLGDTAAAEPLYAEALAHRPRSAAALLGLGLCARRRGDRAAALARLQQAAAADPARPGLQAELAVELREAGRLDEAEAACAAALALHPRFAPALVGLALGARRRGDRAAALAHLREAAAAEPANPGIQAELAFELREAGQLDEAEAAGTAALALRPGFLPALLGLAQCARRRGDRPAAIARLRAVLKAQPGHLAARLDLAAELREAGETGAARAAAQTVLQADPRNLAAWTSLGLTERRAGRRQEARAAFEAALAHHPGSLPPLLDLAAELFALGDAAGAEALLRRAMEHHPQAPGPLAALAQHCRLASRLEEAVALGRRADALAPAIAPAATIVADALFELERVEEALEGLAAAARAAEAPARRAALAAAQVTLLRRAGRIPEAVAAGCTARAEHPEEFALWHAAALAAFRLGVAGEAEAWLAAAPPAGTPAQAHALATCRAEAAELAGDHAAAEAAMREAARLNPLAPHPHDVLARLALLRWDAPAVRHHLGEALRLQAGEVALGRRQARFRLTLPGQLLDEAALVPGLTEALAAALAVPEGPTRLRRLAVLLRAHPEVTATGMALLVALRREGPLRGPPPPEPAPIPPVIAQFWDEAAPPADVRAIMESWPAAHPAHRLVRFDDRSASAWLGRVLGPVVQQAFLRARPAAQRADLLRLAWLAAEGGLWVDADDRCLGPFDPAALAPGATLIGVQEDLGSLGNNLLAAAPRHPVILRALREAVTALNRVDSDIVWLSTGPGLLTRALAAEMLAGPGEAIGLPPGVAVLDRRDWMPVAAMHAAAGYKTSPRHWQHAGPRVPPRAPLPAVDPPPSHP